VYSTFTGQEPATPFQGLLQVESDLFFWADDGILTVKTLWKTDGTTGWNCSGKKY
jgi:hypothetical protein